MVFAFITAWLAYKRAKILGRSPIAWAAIGATVYIGTQLIVSLVLGFVLGVAIVALHLSQSLFDTLSIPVTIVAIVASFLASWLFLKYMDSLPAQGLPESPTSIFNANE